MFGNLGITELLIIVLFWFAPVVIVLTAFVRGMHALVQIPERLERIEALLAQQQQRDASGRF